MRESELSKKKERNTTKSNAENLTSSASLKPPAFNPSSGTIQKKDDSLTKRLSQRGSSNLSRTPMPGGEEVYHGALASKGLKSVGARAMTYDGTIFASDPVSKPESNALYAHERVHEQGSGSKHENSRSDDPEEMAARAVERMVLHKSRSGDDFGETLKDIRANMPGNKNLVDEENI